MFTAATLPYPLIYPQMAQMAQMDDKAFTQAERTLPEQYWVKTREESRDGNLVGGSAEQLASNLT